MVQQHHGMPDHLKVRDNLKMAGDHGSTVLVKSLRTTSQWRPVMGEGDLLYRVASFIMPILTGFAGAIGGIYGAGRKSSEREQAIKDELRDEMAALRKDFDASKDDLSDQFRESFQGIRQKINDVELDAQKRFVDKTDFREFRNEYRENTNRIFEKLDQISSR